MQFKSFSPDQSNWTGIDQIKAALNAASFNYASESPGEWQWAKKHVEEAGTLLALHGWRSWMVDVLFAQFPTLVERHTLNDAWLRAAFAMGAASNVLPTHKEKN